ncbi:MAG: site-specific integrase, partial [Haloarculaceae archaeon]
MSTNLDGDSEESPDDPIEYFLEDITYQGKTPRTREAYGRGLRTFESYLESRDLSLAQANHRDCMAYVHQLRGTVAPSTVASYASYLHRFYDYMLQVGVFEENPMTLVLEEIDESINTDPARRDISVPEMRRFVATIVHPLDRAIVVTLLKTGLRAGELCNLDRRDLTLEAAPDTHDGSRAALDGRPNSLYVPPEPTIEATYNGELRSASNKRQRATTTPVDDELATTLRRWLAIRPDPRSDASPLFCSTADTWGARLT